MAQFGEFVSYSFVTKPTQTVGNFPIIVINDTRRRTDQIKAIFTLGTFSSGRVLIALVNGSRRATEFGRFKVKTGLTLGAVNGLIRRVDLVETVNFTVGNFHDFEALVLLENELGKAL